MTTAETRMETTAITDPVEPASSEASPIVITVKTPLPPAAPSVQLSREQILEATFTCLATEGYDGTTIRRIASHLGCAIGSIYRYFRDKRELLYAVTQELLVPVAKAIELDGSFPRSVALYARLARGDAQAYRLMFWLAWHVETPGQLEDAADPHAALPQVVRQIINGWSTQLNDATLARHAWARTHGLITLGVPEDEIVALVTATVVDRLPTDAIATNAVAGEQTPDAIVEIAPPVEIPSEGSRAERRPPSEDVTLL